MEGRTNALAALIRERSAPLEPRATGEPARGGPLPGVRAVLWDVYGTLLISAAGELELAEPGGGAERFAAALAAAGMRRTESVWDGLGLWQRRVQIHQQQARDRGVDYPEVNVVAIWQEVCQEMIVRGWLRPPSQTVDWLRLAVDYECRVNPVWPMPGLGPCLERLRRQGRILGIVSNAQFFTPLVVAALCGRSLEQLGMDRRLTFFSYHYGYAKPSVRLFHKASAVLAEQGIEPQEVLYVGNDMLNDVAAAAEAGFRTALFAGDARSLRWRSGDGRTAGVQPDLVLDRLASLEAMLAD